MSLLLLFGGPLGPGQILCTPEVLLLTEQVATINRARTVACLTEALKAAFIITGTGGSGTAEYYVDGHTSIVDSISNFTNDADAFDDDGVDYASAIGGAAVLKGTGTNAPTTGGTITLVEGSLKYQASLQINWSVNWSIGYGSIDLLNIGVSDSSVLLTESAYAALDTPIGGWTWAKVAELYARAEIGNF